VIYEFNANNAATSEPPHYSAFNSFVLLRKAGYTLTYKTKIMAPILSWKNTENGFLYLILYSHTFVCYQFVISALSLKGHYPVLCLVLGMQTPYTIMLLFYIICFSFLTR